MSSHSNISIFVPHAGCPFKCSFCDQNAISGETELPHAEDVRRVCEQAKREIASPENTEIAFFGGSFTAIDRGYMTELLDAAAEYVGEGGFKGIRLSTRPDFIDGEVLDLLKSRGVTAIELGAQSLDDGVLNANARGHCSEDIIRSSRLMKQHGFELGLQIMSGLYKSTPEIERRNLRQVLEIAPDTVRIYPVVIIKGTALARLYEQGSFVPMPFDDIVDICSEMLEAFDMAGIKVIKCGLHASEIVERDMLGGFYHPAFRELCEGRIYRRKLESLLNGTGLKAEQKYDITVSAAPSYISRVYGHKKENSLYFRDRGIKLRVLGDADIPKYEIKIKEVKLCT